jgi:hypothetical protein
MLEFDVERVRANVRAATTEDLLDRATVHRAGMEPETLEIIETELCRRGVYADQVEAHAARYGDEVLRRPDGTAVCCSFCERPAVARGWGWHRLTGRLLSRLPLYRPQRCCYCAEHRPASRKEGGATSPAAGRPLPPG